jgi:hypothetical protein
MGEMSLSGRGVGATHRLSFNSKLGIWPFVLVADIRLGLKPILLSPILYLYQLLAHHIELAKHCREPSQLTIVPPLGTLIEGESSLLKGQIKPGSTLTSQRENGASPVLGTGFALDKTKSLKLD